MFRTFVLSHFLMGWGGCIQMDKQWPHAAMRSGEVLWLLASEVKYKWALTTQEGKARRVRRSGGHACHFYWMPLSPLPVVYLKACLLSALHLMKW